MFQAGEFEAQWQPLGLLYVLRTRRGMERFAAQDAMLRDTFGVAARRLEGSELPEFEPALRPGLAGGFLYDGDAFLRPDALTGNWTRWLASRGVRFEEGNRVQGVEKTAGEITRLLTDTGEVTADHYVFREWRLEHGSSSGSWMSSAHRTRQGLLDHHHPAPDLSRAMPCCSRSTAWARRRSTMAFGWAR